MAIDVYCSITYDILNLDDSPASSTFSLIATRTISVQTSDRT
jgi:hypothetical protein